MGGIMIQDKIKDQLKLLRKEIKRLRNEIEIKYSV